MADARPLTLVLLTAVAIAAAAGPASAQQPMPGLKLHASDPATLDQPILARRAPVIGDRKFDEDHTAGPAWTLPFDALPFDALGAFRTLGIGAKDHGGRGLSFSIKRSRGFKGTARLRF